MHICPHCLEEGITSSQKVISVFFGPATCMACHEHSYIRVVYALFALATWIIITWVFIGLSYMAQASFFLLGTIPAMALAFNKFLLQAPLAKSIKNNA